MGTPHTQVSNTASFNTSSRHDSLIKTFPHVSSPMKSKYTRWSNKKKEREEDEAGRHVQKQNEKEQKSLQQNARKKRYAPKHAFSRLSKVIKDLLIPLPEVSM